ncbi:MAG: GGDEF domain-containing protein [Lachnospiraceae bacterium]|nr:GGDEF domain-containing protein [Lachnospiraceae bacterium]
MKKKIAVYANGWSMEAMQQIVEGIRKYAVNEDFDTFVFLSFASYSEYATLNQGELNIYKLADMEDFDGLIVLSTMLNSNETAEELCRQALEKKIPCVSIGMEVEGVPCVRISNAKGMRDLVTHLIEDHNVKRILFIGGTPDHVDSLERLQVTKSVMARYGLTLAEEDIVYGEWGNSVPQHLMDKLVDSGEKLPDAIVCANDIMALAASSELLRKGVSLPEDVIVTGFDNIRPGMDFYPALSTVSQNYANVGFQCCELLFNIIRGREYEPTLILPSSFVKGESCGCSGDRDYASHHRNYCQRSYQVFVDTSLLEQTERVMRQKISEIPDYNSLKTILQNHYTAHHRFEGPDFYLILNSEYFRDATADEEELWTKGFGDKLEVIVALKDGRIQRENEVDHKTLVPGYRKIQGKQHVFYFMPLHYYQYNYGYVVLADDPPLLSENSLYPYLEKLQQSLKLLRSNLRLDALNKNLTLIYDKDPMTGLYNRFIYENKATPLYEECRRKNSHMMVMFVDINYMKRINDRFGHIHGDNAIKTVADSIKANVREGWIPVRFGGDEFLIIAPDSDENDAVKVKNAILDFLEKRNNNGSRPYRISVSCAYVVTDPNSEESLQEYVKEADRLMYEVKQRVHAADANPAKPES